MNLAGVQLALELTKELQRLRNRAQAGSLPEQSLTLELESVLRSLGFVEEAQVRSQRQRRF